MNISKYLETALLNAVFRGTQYTSPANIYVALYTSDPTGSDTGTEVSGAGYSRQQVTFTAPTDVGGKTTIENTSEIEFDVAAGDWGNITHIGLRDASSAGNLLYYGPLTNPRTILTGDRLKFPAGEIKVDLD